MIYIILFILQYKVSTTVMDLVFVFRLFVFMLVPLCFCVAKRFSVNKDLYSSLRGKCVQCRTPTSLIVDAIATDVIRHIVQGGAENCGTLYIGRNDVTESMVTIRSPFCRYNLA